CALFVSSSVLFAQEPLPLDIAKPDNAGKDDLVKEPPAPVSSSPSENKSKPRRLKDYDIPGLEEKVYLDSKQSMDVVQVIETLAHYGRLKNVVIGKGVSGTAKLRLRDVTVAEALEVFLSMNSLAYEVKDGIITIMTDAEYQTLYGTSFYDHKKMKIIGLTYADPTRVGQMLAPVKSNIGTVVPDPITGTLILIDTPEKIKEMETVIKKADIPTIKRILPTETKTFALQYADVASIQPEVMTLISKEAGSVRVDKRTKTLIVTALPHNMKKIEHLIKAFDTPSKQVFIEAKIVEITLSDDLSFGVNWQHLFESLDPRFSLSTVSSPGGPVAPSGTLTYNTIVAGGDLSAILTALKTIGNTKILQNPHITVAEGEEAKIQVVEKQPYKETTIESGTTNITGVTYIFIDVGVTLAVTPKINDDKFITVDIKPEISSISQWYDGPAQEGTPVVKTSVAETTVSVKDGVTIIIGGMIKEEKTTSTVKIPVLGSIPLIGGLFKHDSISVRNVETVVFMTPRIVSGAEPFLRSRDMKKKPKPMRAMGITTDKSLKSIR
ncbi:secretin N-terminal domain-containing protein, partial [Verrucomicrobiota bacterium]